MPASVQGNPPLFGPCRAELSEAVPHSAERKAEADGDLGFSLLGASGGVWLQVYFSR